LSYDSRYFFILPQMVDDTGLVQLSVCAVEDKHY